MYAVSASAVFSAAHALLIRGQREPLHGHDWRVRVTVRGPSLDADGMLCDFHAVEAALRAATSPLHNANLNELPPFRTRNASAENVARHIADALAADTVLAEARVRIAAVRVTEAPGCAATYYPAHARHGHTAPTPTAAAEPHRPKDR